jgi:DNA sulfur modification protein DndD
MIIHSITLQNFGIYAGTHTFDLSPRDDGRFQQPIILLRGQNGSGKSTLMEAIRLGLHGKLSLGNRSTQREYELYLERRIFRGPDGVTAPFAAIQIEFDHVFLGQRHHYRVERQWAKPNSRLSSEVRLWVDGELNPGDEEENEYLLRELIPPGMAELFFFDGEKINTLAEAGDGGDALLAETVKNLLGLHLVEQLDRDLDVYLTRQTGAQELQQYQAELSQLRSELETLTEARANKQAILADCRRHLQAKRETITLLEQRIAREGGQYAAAQTARNEERERLLEDLGRNEQEIFELSRGVMPFAVAPNLLKAVRRHLDQEAAYEKWQAAQPLVAKLQNHPEVREASVVYNVHASDEAVSNEADFVGYVRQVVAEFSQPPLPETAVVHRVSPEMRGVLFNWIDEALTEAPQALAAALQKRERLQAQLMAVDEALDRVPVEQILQPLQNELRQQDRELGRLEAELDRLTAEDKQLAHHIERVTNSNRRVTEQMTAINTDEGRIRLAARAKLLLDDYQRRLIGQKLDQLAAQLSKRLNQLNRKRDFIDRVEIDPQTFTIAIYRTGKLFPRSQLSAGEQQMFAIATLWALREVSGRPLPVVIDTPLSRLDEKHRQAMLVEFMPQVAQQVIVLATTSEIDEATFRFMQPAVARAYLLEADRTAAQATEQPLSQPTVHIGIKEIVSHAI